MDRRLQDRVALAWGGSADIHQHITGPDYTLEALASRRGVRSARDEAAAAGGEMPRFLAAEGSYDRPVAAAGHPTADSTEAMRAAARWRERWFRLWKRSQLPAKLIAFFDELNTAEMGEAVSAAVAEHALETVGGYKAVVFLPEISAGSEDGADGVALLRASRFAQPGLVAAPDLSAVAEPWWSELSAFLDDPQVAMVAHVPFGDRGVLLVAERRADRVFDGDDWEVLATLAEQGDRALARIRMLESAYELSLTDPLTGLANRRQMEVVLKHAWAAAERGEGLAVMMLDLDRFKTLNDTHGHAFGDQILEIAAECLREEARGADAVVRYGGDEFLVIMPRGCAEGARSLAARVRGRLEGWVGISAGVAEYHPSYVTPRDLINTADEDLYRNKARRFFESPKVVEC